MLNASLTVRAHNANSHKKKARHHSKPALHVQAVAPRAPDTCDTRASPCALI